MDTPHTLPFYLLGTDNITFYEAQWILAIVGVILSLGWQVARRDKLSENTPEDFSWRFFRIDNGKRIVATLLFIYVFLRFPDQFLATKIDGLTETWRLFIALAIGFGNDKLAQLAKNKNLFGLFDSSVRKSADNEVAPPPVSPDKPQ